MPVNDQGDAYKFLYPFGWQEVSVSGQDVVYKDIIEPLESASVNLVPTDKDDITLFGTPEEVRSLALQNAALAPCRDLPAPLLPQLRLSQRQCGPELVVELYGMCKQVRCQVPAHLD